MLSTSVTFSIQLLVSPGSITSGVQAEASVYRDLYDYSASSFFQNLLGTVGRWPNTSLRHSHLELPLFGAVG